MSSTHTLASYSLPIYDSHPPPHTHTELTHGWWGITRPDTVDRLLRTLCTRGVREKFLSKHLQKNKDNINAILNPKLLSSFETSVRDHFRIKSITESAGESSSLLCEETQQESSTEEVKMETDEITDSVGVMMETDESTDSVGVKSKIEASRSTNGTNSVVVESKIGANRSTNKNGEMLSHDTNDPQFPAYCLEVLLSVVEYLEGMQSRLITAQLHNEVHVRCIHVLYMYKCSLFRGWFMDCVTVVHVHVCFTAMKYRIAIDCPIFTSYVPLIAYVLLTVYRELSYGIV